MGFFNKLRTDGATYDGQGEERRGFIDVIQYNGDNTDLVWKFPYNNISIGAQLIVNRSQEAIFVKGGAICDVFGEGTHTLSAKNLPLLDKIINLPFGGKTPFVAEVWFVNKVIRRGLKFGTKSPIRVIDPRYREIEMGIPVRAHGDYSVRINDGLLLLNEFVGTQHLLDTDEFEEKFKTMVQQELNSQIKKYSRVEQISPLDFPEYAPEIADFVKNNISEKFRAYGMEIVDMQFAHIAPNEDDPVVKELYDNRITAAKERERRNIQGFTYQQERQLDIMETAAGNEGNAGNVMGAGIGMGMGVGMGVAFGGQMQNMGQQTMNMQNNNVPPPPQTTIQYYIYQNNMQQGPFDMPTMATLIRSGAITAQTNVWKNGMPAWAAAGTIAELSVMFGGPATPPPPPPAMP